MRIDRAQFSYFIFCLSVRVKVYFQPDLSIPVPRENIMALKPYCEKCCAYFNNKSNLNAHNKSRHGVTAFTNGYKCPGPGCSKVYKMKRNVKPHFLKYRSSSEQDWEIAYQQINATPIPNKSNTF